MKKMKKVFAMLLALAMVLGMSMTAFAAPVNENGVPNQNDTWTAEVKNIKENNVTVTAYKIVKAEYNTSGFTGYAWVKAPMEGDKEMPLYTTGANPELNINDQTIATFAKEAVSAAKPYGDGVVMTYDAATKSYKADLNPGSYVVLVTGSNAVVYNPMLVSVYYSVSGSNSTMQSTPVTDANWELNATNAFAKSSTPTIDKKIVNSGSESDKGDDIAVGDTVTFEITATVPSYSDEYKAPVFKVTDTISAGLKYTGVPVVTIDDGLDESRDSVTFPAAMYELKWYTNADKAEANETSEMTEATTFELNFNSAQVKEEAGRRITITYTAQLTEDAGKNFDPNTNKATLNYSNSPNDTTGAGNTDKTTYHYTFSIGGELLASNTQITKDILEVMKKTGVEHTEMQGTEEVTTTALSGATFSLTKAGETKVLKTDDTDAYGHLLFEGLDAGQYILQETAAPESYSLNDTRYLVEIVPHYAADGKLENFEVKIGTLVEKTEDGKTIYTFAETTPVSSKFTAQYDGTTSTITNITKDENNGVLDIPNTQITSLPSTGGIGTTIFTIAGCLIMVVAAGLFFASRRKSAAK